MEFKRSVPPTKHQFAAMSKSRELQSILLRKKILKSSSTGSLGTAEGDNVFDSIANSGEQYKARIASLQSFKKKSKSVTEGHIHRLEWLKEHAHLHALSHNLERDIEGLLEVILLHGGAGTDIAGLVDEGEACGRSREENEKAIVSQLRDIKSMLREVAKNVSRRREAEAGAESKHEGRDGISAPMCDNAAVSVFADILMQLHTQHSNSWKSMKAHESELYESVLSDRRAIITSLREDVLSLQNNLLHSEFELRCDDDVEVEIFMDEWVQKLGTLAEAHANELKVLRGEREAANLRRQLDLLGSSVTVEEEAKDGSAEGAPLRGGWAVEDHEVFVKMYKNALASGAQRPAVMSALRVQLPHKSVEDLSSHEGWYRRLRAVVGKRRDLAARYAATREALIKQAKEELTQFREQRRKEEAHAQKIKEHEDMRGQLHDRLEQLRLGRRRAEELFLEEERRQLLEQVNRERIFADAAKAEAEEKKNKVAQYKRAKHCLQEMQQKLQEEQAHQEEERVKREVEENRWRVEMREHNRLEREEDKRRCEEQQLQLEQRRLEWLARLAEQVPYWEALQNAQSRLDHVTASAKAWEYVSSGPGARGYLPLNGFADNKVMKDARVRLAMALRDAGVQNSQYAAQVVREFHPRPQLAIHGIL